MPTVPTPDLSVDELVHLLATLGRTRQLSPAVPVSQLDHALQTAALLEHARPDDVELAVAGLVHDIGHLLPGGTDEAHAGDGAGVVRSSLGERVAGIVGLHVEAKRYLVGVEGGYDGELSADSVVSLRRQGGSLEAAEAEAFVRLPLAGDAVTLRRADDHGKAEGLVVRPLESWVPQLRALSDRVLSKGPAFPRT
jgi:predicted HD phosphohydrolase